MDFMKQWITEDSFSLQEKLYFAGCDAYGRARLGTLLSLMAEVSGHDFDTRGLTYEKLFAIKQVILLSRLSLKIHKHPLLGDLLTITTWENGTNRLFLKRNYEMSTQDGSLCVSGKSDWLLVDPENRKILHPDTFKGKELTICPKEIDCSECKKVILPQDGLLELGRRRIVYSDLDYNGHLHSGNYGDIIWDYMPSELQDKHLKEFSINYNKEATLGDELRIRGFQNENTFIMEGLHDDGICYTCECVF